MQIFNWDRHIKMLSSLVSDQNNSWNLKYLTNLCLLIIILMTSTLTKNISNLECITYWILPVFYLSSRFHMTNLTKLTYNIKYHCDCSINEFMSWPVLSKCKIWPLINESFTRNLTGTHQIRLVVTNVTPNTKAIQSRNELERVYTKYFRIYFLIWDFNRPIIIVES